MIIGWVFLLFAAGSCCGAPAAATRASPLLLERVVVSGIAAQPS